SIIRVLFPKPLGSSVHIRGDRGDLCKAHLVRLGGDELLRSSPVEQVTLPHTELLQNVLGLASRTARHQQPPLISYRQRERRPLIVVGGAVHNRVLAFADDVRETLQELVEIAHGSPRSVFIQEPASRSQCSTLIAGALRLRERTSPRTSRPGNLEDRGHGPSPLPHRTAARRSALPVRLGERTRAARDVPCFYTPRQTGLPTDPLRRLSPAGLGDARSVGTWGLGTRPHPGSRAPAPD